MLLLCVFYIKLIWSKWNTKNFSTYSILKLSFVELLLHKILFVCIIFLVKNPIKSVIEISKFLFDLSPSHKVTIGLKGYMSPKTVYNFEKCTTTTSLRFHTHQLFNLILSNDVFAANSLIRLCWWCSWHYHIYLKVIKVYIILKSIQYIMLQTSYFIAKASLTKCMLVSRAFDSIIVKSKNLFSLVS